MRLLLNISPLALVAVVLSRTTITPIKAFSPDVVGVVRRQRLRQQHFCRRHHLQSQQQRLFGSNNDQQEIDLGLTPELKRVTDAFAAIQDEQVRYKQLLYMAQNTKEANSFPETSKIPENKVPGCLSTVYVDGTAQYNKDIDDYVINFVGDSDGLLTKGLVALLVRYVH
jgi:sulfur transfer protein SufE